MTLRSFSHSQKIVVLMIGVVMTLAACGSGTPPPAPSATAASTAAPSAAAPAAPIAQNDQPSAEFACGFITKNEAVAALGFDPGPGHIDKSGAIFAPGNPTICAWGDPMHFDIPVIDMYAQKYPTASAAREAFELLKKREHAAATALNRVDDYPVGYGALITASPGTGTDKGASSAEIGTGSWIISIFYYHAPDDTDRNTKVAIKLAQAVVNHLP
jgi:hypothetical protein